MCPKSDCLCDKVYETSWWMLAYGADTPKRLKALSNWASVTNLNTGTMARQQMRDQTKYQTVRSLLSNCSLDCLLTSIFMHVYFIKFDFLRKERKEMVWNFEFKENSVTHMKLEV